MKIKEIYHHIEDIWFKQNEKIRFLLVGGFNTTTAFLIYFTCLCITQGKEQLSLLVMNLININISIATMRYYVFCSHRPFLKEYSKAFGSYIVLYFINIGLLAFFVKIIHLEEVLPIDSILSEIPNLNKAIAQICSVLIITIMTFCVHKYFSFKK